MYLIEQKRFLLSMMLLLLSSVIVNAYDFKSDGIYYNIGDNNTVSVTSGDKKYEGDIVIPSKVTYNSVSYNVTSIGDDAFGYSSYLTSITIPNNVAIIGNYAFKYCSGLTSITIPNTMKNIGDYAFIGCTCLTSVTIPNSVVSIGDGAFLGCYDLTSITIPGSVTSIGNSAFQECSGLTSITVSSENTIYDSRNSCNAIIETSSNTLIKACVNTVIPNSVTSIGKNAFSGCSGLTSILIPNSVTTIGEGAFGGCRGLTSITIPNSVTSIETYAFNHCDNLVSIYIPESVSSLSHSAFWYCDGLSSIRVDENNPYYDSRNNCNAIIRTNSNTLMNGCKNTIIPNNIVTIGQGAFMDCSGLKSIILPDGLKIIYADAFAESGIETIYIPNTVTYIGQDSFAGCMNLSIITIPNSVTSIIDGAFYGCSNLIKVVSEIKNPYNINSGIFENISSEAILYVPTGTKEKYQAYEGWTINFKEIIESSSESGSTNITFADANVKAICVANWDTNSDGELSEQEAAAIKEIGTTFKGNTTIKSFDELKYFIGLETISERAFSGCNSLTLITIPNSVTNIGEHAFNQCSSLTSITIPKSVTGIGHRAFEGCSDLTSIKVESGNTKYDSRDNCNAIIETTSNALIAGCKNTTIPNCVTYIGYEAFRDCSGLTSITIPNSVTSIGNNAFYDCSKLQEVKSEIINPYYIDNSVFSNISSEAILYVPTGTKQKYQAFSGWTKNFKGIIESTTGTTNYTLSIKATGDGSASFNGAVIRNETNSFTVDEGTNATITFSPDNGYRLASVRLNNSDVSSLVYNNQYTISNISSNTTVEVTFEAIPVTTYSLSISASGNGYVSYNGNAVRNRTQSFTVNEGTSATIIFTPDNGNSISSVKLNNSDITSQISSNSYTISNITANTTLSVTFQEDVNALTVDGLNYTVTSQSNRTVTLTSGVTGLVLTVPATITQNGTTWKVTGIDKDALKGNVELAAIIWNPEAAFTATVSNPNLLLYVKSSDYAPAAIQNVVVNGTASNIILAEAKSGNNFYCPQSFVAQKISYTHNYQMQTGIGESRGWETIALPFDVQTVTHATKGEIKPFAQWKSGDAAKPFWLYELAGTGFVETGSIKAYTPYIISMPNNPQYDGQWLLNGKVTFAASSVTIGKTENLSQPTFQSRAFIPCFAEIRSDAGVHALNVNNDFETNNSGMTEGSRFVLNMRSVHPFEAYMKSSSSAPPYAIGVFEDMTTGIQMMINGSWTKQEVVYDLQGRKVNAPSKKGVYIINGKKKIIR